jgi:putative tryptophan/tyrosine transport system substrate-binding protein
MRRRDFIAACAAATLSHEARGEPDEPVVGFLNIGAPEERTWAVAAFRNGLKEAGFIEGQNVLVEYRWARDQYDKLPGLVADLIQRRVAVIATGGGPGPALAAKAATQTIPIVFNHGGDPIQEGLVASLAHPGGNATGIINLHVELEPKRLELLHEIVPKTTMIGVLVNPAFPDAQAQLRLVEKAATPLGLELHIENANKISDLDIAFANFVNERVGAVYRNAFAAMVHAGADGVYVSQDAENDAYGQVIVDLAEKCRLPAVYGSRAAAAIGGLMAYAYDLSDLVRHNADQIDQIFKGAKPGDIPYYQARKFDLIINLKTAKALDLAVPPCGLASRFAGAAADACDCCHECHRTELSGTNSSPPHPPIASRWAPPSPARGEGIAGVFGSDSLRSRHPRRPSRSGCDADHREPTPASPTCGSILIIRWTPWNRGASALH